MIRRFLDRIFGIDARSLAAFRVAIGCILLVDLWIRGASIPEHYSDAGLLPRKLWVDGTTGSFEWSLHAMNGEAGFQRVLFAAAAVAAVMLVVGWRTRLATFLSWLLVASIQLRNEYLINGGDILLRVLLFWAMFLPLGARWSLDRLFALRGAAPASATAPAPLANRRDTDQLAVDFALPAAPIIPIRVLSVASACIIVQFLLMYMCSGLFKLNEVWSSGDALRRSLHVDMYVKPVGLALRESEPLLTLASRALPWVEMVLPALCLLPVLTSWWRGVAIVVLVLLHVSIELTLTTGLFSWVCMAGWLLLVPGAWWDVVLRRRDAAASGDHEHRAGGAIPQHAPSRPPIRHLGDGLLLFLLGYVVVWNISTLREHFTREPVLTESQRWLGELTALKQKWDMFTDPPSDTGWYEVTGTTQAGKEIDLLTGGAATAGLEPPAESITGLYIDHRWRKHMASVATDAFRGHRSRLALALAQRWNRLHSPEEDIVWIEVAFVRQVTPKPGDAAAPVRRVVMHKGPVE